MTVEDCLKKGQGKTVEFERILIGRISIADSSIWHTTRSSIPNLSEIDLA